MTVVVDPTAAFGRATTYRLRVPARPVGGEISDPLVREIRGTIYSSHRSKMAQRAVVAVRAVLLTIGIILIVYGLGRVLGLMVLDWLGWSQP